MKHRYTITHSIGELVALSDGPNHGLHRFDASCVTHKYAELNTDVRDWLDQSGINHSVASVRSLEDSGEPPPYDTKYSWNYFIEFDSASDLMMFKLAWG